MRGDVARVGQRRLDPCTFLQEMTLFSAENDTVRRAKHGFSDWEVVDVSVVDEPLWDRLL